MTINKERTQILAEKFFFMLVATDCLKNICELLTVSELILDNYISVKEVLKTINRLLNRKAVKSDRILNEILKHIVLKICTDVVYRICTALIYSLLSECFKKLIIIILYKEDKKNYLLSESYRLIALKNIFMKIIEKVLATYLNYAAEKHFLFF